MNSNFYSHFILQRTRAVSKSLIDNIFLNTLYRTCVHARMRVRTYACAHMCIYITLFANLLTFRSCR